MRIQVRTIKWIKQINAAGLLFVALSMVFLPAQPIQAQGACCIKQRISSVSGDVASVEKTEILGCYLISNTPCNITPEITACPGARTREGRGCAQVVEVEKQVSCVQYASNCPDALSSVKLDCQRLSQDECTVAAKACFWDGAHCYSRFDLDLCEDLQPKFCGTAEGTAPTVCSYAAGRCNKVTEGELAKRYEQQRPGILPPCAYAGNCREVNDIVETAVNYGQMVFTVIGSFAFVFFIIGGVLVITSFGNTERVNKGKMMITAAVVGLIIAFGAYFLVTAVLQALQVGTEFRP